jgi:hypothetical protein
LENNSSKEIISNLTSENSLLKSIASASLVITSILGGYAIWKHYQQKKVSVGATPYETPNQHTDFIESDTEKMGVTKKKLLLA